MQSTANPGTVKQMDVAGAGRHYQVPSGLMLPSVTNILGVIAKPALIHWVANQERAMVIEAAASLWEDIPTGKKMPRTAYVTTLTERIGKTKAHQKALAKAGEIGSQVHSFIEWSLRKELGQQVGPEPRLSDKATWAFMVYEEWRKGTVLTPKAIEQVVWHAEAGYAGTMDLLADLVLDEGSPVTAVLDWKTGKAIYPEALLQNAAYVHALVALGHLPAPCHGVIVRLPKVESDPAFEVRVITPAEQGRLFLTFLAVKALWDWQQEKHWQTTPAPPPPPPTTPTPSPSPPTPQAPTAPALTPKKPAAAPAAVLGIDTDDEGQALANAIEAERAKLSRQPEAAQWARLCTALAGTTVLELADPAALHDLLAFTRALVAKDPAARARARQILGL